jgi:short-subunit dehydrogenase
MKLLENPSVLVTGASSGIGAEVSRLLADRGATLILIARDQDGLEKVATAVRERGGRAIVAAADVTDAEALERAVDSAVEQSGGLDVAILNAGAAAYGELREMSADDVRQTLDVTLVGAANTVLAVLPHLELSSGQLVATGSVAALQPQPLMAAYSAAKHGLRALLESLRLELRAAGATVDVSIVHPGPVDTPFWQHVRSIGIAPPEPPAAYSVQDVARILVAAVDDPRPERVVGPSMRLAVLLRAIARPLSDIALGAVARWSIDNESQQETADGLGNPTGDDRRSVDVPFQLGAIRSRIARAF